MRRETLIELTGGCDDGETNEKTLEKSSPPRRVSPSPRHCREEGISLFSNTSEQREIILRQVLSSAALDLSLVYGQWCQLVTLLPMVQASKFAAFEALFALAGDARGNTASASSLKDRGNAFAKLLKRNRRCPFFFPDGLLSLRTKWR